MAEVVRRALALVLALAMAGCAAMREPPEEALGPPDLVLEFAREDVPALAVRCSLAFRGDASGESELRIDPAVGEERIDLRAGDEHGKALSVRHPEPHRWIVRHEPNAWVRVAWVWPGNERGGLPPAEAGFRPIVDDAAFHAVGHFALALPSFLDERAPRTVEIAFQGFAAERTCLTSFGEGAGPRRFRASLSELRDAVYVAAPLTVVERDLEGGAALVALEPAAMALSAEELADAVAAVLDEGRRIFDDGGPDQVVVTVLGTGEPSAGGFSFVGAPLTRSFAFLVAPDTGTAGETGELLRFLAHESMHRWIGGAIRLADPAGAEAWFSEGFCDFLAWRILRRSGLLEPDALAEELNLLLAEHAANPRQGVGNDAIADGFLEDQDLAALAYQRGALVALAFAHRLRQDDDSGRSFEAFLRELLERSRAGARPFDTDALLGRMGAVTDLEFESRLRRCVVEGAPLELDADVAAPLLRLVHAGGLPRFVPAGDP